jgi:mono/diheme cytochrome c family protein
MSRLARSLAMIVGIGCAVIAEGCGASRPTPPPGLNEVQLAGWRVYVDLDCAACHGESREGKRTAPPITDISENWTADQLVSYLTDPNAMVRSNPRLAYKAEKYAIGMPKVSGKAPGYAGKVSEDKLRELAEYLLVDIKP